MISGLEYKTKNKTEEVSTVYTWRSNGYHEKSIPHDNVSFEIWNQDVIDLVWFKWYDIGEPIASVGVGLLNEILSTLI